MPEDLDKDHLEDRDDHLGDLNTGLLGRDQVSLITAFPLKYFSKLTLESTFVLFNNLDEEHELARGVGGADNPLRVQSPLKAPEPLSSPGNLLLLLSLKLTLVPRPGFGLLPPFLELLKIDQ